MSKSKIWTYFRIIWLLFFFSFAVIPLFNSVQAATPAIEVLTVKGTINPISADYIARGIDKAEQDNATVCIIQLDTPGGLDTAMRDIVQKIVNSSVPVVVYVSPAGARAASAGTFITMAAHVAAMAPNTSIGAAHPVSIGDTGSGNTTEDEKILNDAVSYIKSLAQSHGRNPDWAEKAVRLSITATEQEALKQNIIELVATDLDSLITQLDGRQVKMLQGNTITLVTDGVRITHVNMNWVENFLHTIASPDVAYILLSIAALGIMAEIFNPGLIFPGIIGGICGLLAAYALGMLPVNIAGILLILLAFGLFIAEALTPGFGLLFSGGVISLIIGSLILFKGGSASLRVSPGVIATVVIIIAAFFGFVVERVVRTHRRQVTTGREEMIGKNAVARTDLTPEGQVFYKGERWNAVSESGNIAANKTVVITRLNGLTLYVRKIQNK